MLLFLLFACPTPPQNVCMADKSWIDKPSMPKEVSADETFCDFYQFSWQWFLAQTSPSNVPEERVFETNRVFDPQISSDQCNISNLQGKQALLEQLEPRSIKPNEFEHVEADGGALYDQNGNIMYYGVYYADVQCDATLQGFKEGTIEIKTAWKVLESPNSSYYTIKNNLPSETMLLGLVGIHLAIWTPKHPEMIWATWEHKENAPLCNGTSPKQKWSFIGEEANACLYKKNTSLSEPPKECSQYNYNTYTQFMGKPPLKGLPNNICRKYQYGNEYTEAINGNDTKENAQTIEQLNEAIVGKNGLLTNLDKSHPMHVWSNYEMIGAIWTKDGANSGKSPVPTPNSKGDPQSPQRGSLELTNMSMESFQQGDQSYIPNCFGCHNYNKEKPLNVSHIQSKLKTQ